MTLCKCGCLQPVRTNRNKYVAGHHWFDPEYYEKTTKTMRENHANVSGQNNPMYKQTHTLEVRQKISSLKWKTKKEDSPYYWRKKLHKECDSCCLCKSKKYLQMHHIDEDQLNNKRANLCIICKRCHNFWHGR